jgi:hypothetical protein
MSAHPWGVTELSELENAEEPARDPFGLPVNFDGGPRWERREPALGFVEGSPECVRIKGFEIESERVYLRLKGEEPEF